MPFKSEPQFLAEMLDFARQMTLLYLGKLDNADKMKRFDIGEYRTNSVYWLVAHLAFAENALILKGVGEKGLDIPWFDNFRMGTNPDELKNPPSYEEVFQVFNDVHKASLELLNNLQDDILEEINKSGISFAASRTKRMIARQCIRHECYHCGQIGMLLRMHGKKVV